MPASDPHIVARAEWGADPLATPAGNIPVPSKENWLHHSAGEQFGPAGMRMLQAFTLHRPDEHYVDLEYTFVVDHASCVVYESRGPGKNSAATGGHNDVSHAVCVMGNFQTDPVSPQLIETLANLVAWGYGQGWWPLGFTGGHRDASGNSTACPGDHLEAVISTINARAAVIHAGTVDGPVVVPPAPSSKEEPMLIPSNQVNADGTFRGVEVDVTAQTITPLGGAALVPNPADTIAGWKWRGAFKAADRPADGSAQVQVVNTDLHHETFVIK